MVTVSLIHKLTKVGLKTNSITYIEQTKQDAVVNDIDMFFC